MVHATPRHGALQSVPIYTYDTETGDIIMNENAAFFTVTLGMPTLSDVLFVAWIVVAIAAIIYTVRKCK